VVAGTAGPPRVAFGEAGPPRVALGEAGSVTGGDIGGTAGSVGSPSFFSESEGFAGNGGSTGVTEDNPGGRGVFGVCASSGMNDSV